MNKLEISVAIIAAICLVGVIILLSTGKDTTILMPILTALIGALIGNKKEQVVGFFKGK